MRVRCIFRIFLVFFGFSITLPAQTCTGLCLQQVRCPNGGTTSISGTVYMPNGTDPLPNALVYIPNAPVDGFSAGVSCPAVGALPSGSPLVGTTTAVDGTFTLTNVPVGSNIPLVVVSGRWRRQVVVPSTASCANTLFSTRMPRNQSEGDIPKIAVVTGAADEVECVLRKVGVQDSEFTDPSGNGRINFYLANDGLALGASGPGAQIDQNTPLESTLMGTTSTMNQYDVVMLPCAGGQIGKSTAELSNFVSFSNAGGRVYSSHYSYDYIYTNPNQAAVANWQPSEGFTYPQEEDSGTATVNIGFADGETLAQWLQATNATTTEGQITIDNLRHDLTGVIPPTQSWLTLNDTTDNNPVMQFVYDAPVGAANKCGKVLFNEYHVEEPAPGTSPQGATFPNECSAAGTPLTSQEKLLEYMLFELTNDGGEPTLSPTSADFGQLPIGFTSATTSFTWTNNSVFPASASPSVGTANFLVTSSNCQNVPANSSCTIGVAMRPTALGTLTDTLTVNSTGPAVTASLTGVGIPALTFSNPGLNFGNHDVGSSSTQVITVTNSAPGTVSVPAISTTGDYATLTSCSSTLAQNASCTISVIFTPTTTGDRPGTLTVGTNTPIALDGNGVDFTITISPTSGQVVAGLSTNTTATTTPIAGFAFGVTVSCTSTAPAATCSFTNGVFVPTVPAETAVTITTVSEYTVVGYTGGLLWFVGALTGGLLWWRRRNGGSLARASLLALLLAVAGLGMTGCSGKLPAKNASYTPTGNYTVTVTATDGFLVHSATYSLKVTAD